MRHVGYKINMDSTLHVSGPMASLRAFLYSDGATVYVLQPSTSYVYIFFGLPSRISPRTSFNDSVFC